MWTNTKAATIGLPSWDLSALCNRFLFFLLQRTGGIGALVVALGASDYRAFFQRLLHQVLAVAVRAFFRNRTVGGSELALGIVRAAIERGAATPRFLFDQLAGMALGTLHADEVLLHPFAIGISAARYELAVAAMPQNQVASALRACFFQRDIWNLLLLV